MVVLLVLVTLLQQAEDGPLSPGALRARAIAAFDKDGDGRLNAIEREALRKSGKRFAPEKPRYRRGGSKRQKFSPETVARFDEDKDGKLSQEEYDAAIGVVYRRWLELVREYQAFEDDKPVVENLRLLEQDAKGGKIRDFPPVLFAWIKGSIDRAGSDDGEKSEHPLAEFDADRDARLSPPELAAARAAIQARLKKARESHSKQESTADDQAEKPRG